MSLASVNFEDSLERNISSSDEQFLCAGAASDVWLIHSSPTSTKKIKKRIRVSVETFQKNKHLWIAFQEEFLQKVQLWSTLRHTHVAQLEMSPTNDLVILSAYYPRGDLRSHLRTGLSQSSIYTLIRDILSGLCYLHSHAPQIIHGNINPGKIFIDANESAIIGEFGLASSTMGFPHLVPAVSHAGLIRWISPEMLNKQTAKPTVHSDAWALGCTLFEVITGKLPYSQYRHDVKVTQRIRLGELPGSRNDMSISTANSEAWESIWTLIDRCWLSPPTSRPNYQQLLGYQMRLPLARWNTDEIVHCFAISNAGSPVYSVAISHDGTRIASGSSNSRVCVWDVHTGSLVLGPLKGHKDLVRSVAFCPSNNHVVSGSDDGTIRIWDAHTGAPIGQPLWGHTNGVLSVAFSPSTRIVSGSGDKTIRMWDSNTGIPIGDPFKGHTDYVYSVAFSHDSSRIVSGSWDCTIRIWDVRTGAPIGEPLKGHIGPVTSVGFSHDSTRIVSGSWDCTIRIWDAHTGALTGEPLMGHTDWVYSVAFSLDSTHIVSGSSDQTVRIWDARTGAPIGEQLMGHTGRVMSVVFSPDSSRIISGSEDGTIRVWKAPQSTPSHDILAQHDPPSSDIVTSKMSVQAMFDYLVRHGCTDLSSLMHPDRYSSFAFARGGSGDVWRGEMINGVRVAIKCVLPELHLKDSEGGKERAMHEIYIWSKAKHDNVQQLTGIMMFQGGLGLVSPWMEHGNLQEYLEAHPDVERYPLCVQLAAGVSYLHSVGMVHGDLKAVNVLVSSDRVLKINALDHATLAIATLQFSTTSKSGGGPLRWMAPELLEQDEDIGSPSPTMRNQQTDIYALGMTILETITGRVPYSEYRTDGAILRAIDRRLTPKRPKELLDPDGRSDDIWALLMRCWDYDPAARPEAWHVLSSLQALVV